MMGLGNCDPGALRNSSRGHSTSPTAKGAAAAETAAFTQAAKDAHGHDHPESLPTVDV